MGAPILRKLGTDADPIVNADWRERIMWRFGDDDVADRRMIETFTSLRDRARGPVEPAKELLDPGPVLHELRVIKGDAELEHMRRAATLSAETHAALMRHVQPAQVK